MSSSKVTLGIAGTANSGGGIQPHIDIDYPESLDQEFNFDELLGGDFIIELKHTTEYISLRFIARPSTVHSYQAGRPGRMWIGMTIPRGKRFAHDVSPYTVLKAVLETFRQYYMNPRSDGSYEFKPGTYKRAPFDDLLDNRYPLEDFPGKYVEMHGGGPAVVCLSNEDELTRFFADTQYDEFKEYSAIRVTLNPAWSGAGRLKVEIPRPINFKVYCFGQRYDVLTSPDQPFDRTIPPTDEFHNPVQIKFTLSELRKGECSAYAKVDEAKEEIHLFPVFPDRNFRVEFDFRPSTGTLADMQCDPMRFSLVTSGLPKKELRWEQGKCYAAFVGIQANERWDLRYDSGASEPRFKYVVTGLNPKDGGTAVVILTPLAPFQGIRFSGARCLKENACLKVAFSNRDVFSRPVSRDGEIVKLPGRKETDIEKISIVSDRYFYPELNRSYDPVTGWISVLLNSEPTFRGTSAEGAGFEKSGKLVIENRAVGFSASVRAVFHDGTELNWGTKDFNRQESGKEDSLPIPYPFGTETWLDRVYLSHPKDYDGGKYKGMVFASHPNTRIGERSLSTLDSNGNYKIVIDVVLAPTFWEKLFVWLKGKKVRRWWLIVGLLAALLAGIGSCLAWQHYKPMLSALISRNKEEVSDELTGIRQDVRKENENAKDEEEDETNGAAEQIEDNVVDPAPSQPSNTYNLPAEDAAKIGPYVYLMKHLQSQSGEPLTFDMVKSIQNWQAGISNAAGNKDLGPNFNFIKKYIGQFSRAVDEINRIKDGTYRSKGLTVEDYYRNCKELVKVCSICTGEDLKPFRIAIQNLAIMGDADLADTRKCEFIRRAVLSGAPADVKILADVNSFRGIKDKYNSQ